MGPVGPVGPVDPVGLAGPVGPTGPVRSEARHKPALRLESLIRFRVPKGILLEIQFLDPDPDLGADPGPELDLDLGPGPDRIQMAIGRLRIEKQINP